MSGENKLALWLSGAAVVVASLSFYVFLLHEKDHDRADYMPLVWGILLFLLAIALVSWATWRNLKDATRAASLHAQIVTIKEEHKLELAAAKRALPPTLEITDLQITIRRLEREKEEAVRVANHLNDLGRKREEILAKCQAGQLDLKRQLEEQDFPRIYVSLKALGEVPDHPLDSHLVLTNRSREPAHKVSVATLELRAGSVTFDGPIGVIPPDESEELTPRCERFGPAFSRDVVRALQKEFETYNDALVREKISIPILVTYANYREEKFETRCEMVYNGIAHGLQTIGVKGKVVEFHNFTFGKCTQ